jgi:hypothetical protein
MGQTFKLAKVIRDEDAKELNALLTDRRATIDRICAWLEAKNYKVSRTAVHQYRTRFLKEFLPDGTPTADAMVAVRARLRRSLQSLTLNQLGALCKIAEELASANAAVLASGIRLK